MYRNHFDLPLRPFENTPDPAFFYSGQQHREIIAAMIRSVVSRRSLLVVSGPIGSGKTTLGRTLTRYLPDNTSVVSVFHPLSAPGELLNFVAHHLAIDPPPPSRLILIEAIRRNLEDIHRQDGRLLVLIDEAQLLDDDSLEEIRLLTNLETAKAKLAQVILLGQPELLDTLKRYEMSSLRQRISSIKVIEPFDEIHTRRYILHRLRVAGGRTDIFDADALNLIVEIAGGIPRTINQLCDQALVQAFDTKKDRVGIEEAAMAADDAGLPVPESWRGKMEERDQADEPAEEPSAPAGESDPQTPPTRLRAEISSPMEAQGPDSIEPEPFRDMSASSGTVTADANDILAVLTGETDQVKKKPVLTWPLIILLLALFPIILGLIFYLTGPSKPNHPYSVTPPQSSHQAERSPALPPPPDGRD